jgi:hypothetical protein
MPETGEEFAALQDRTARSPLGGAAAMVIALYLYTEHPALGEDCLVAATAKEGPSAHDMQLIRRQLAAHPHLPRSYIRGATPENGYSLPEPPYELQFTDNPYSGDPASSQYKVFVHCSGAASPRPITLVQNAQGIWKASEWSSLIVGIVPPQTDR